MSKIALTRRGVMGAAVAGAALGTLDVALPQAALAQKRASADLTGSRVDAALRAAHSQYKILNEGKNADYIPALAQVPSHYFGIALARADGEVHEVGDSKQLFSIQ